MWVAGILGFFLTALCMKLVDYVVKTTNLEDEAES